MASSVTTFAVSSIIFFVVGFFCGRLYPKQKQSAEPTRIPPLADNMTPETHLPPLADNMTPVYDYIKDEKELELQRNVAYGPL